ncbi:MAG: DNA mismatch repair protein MutS [Treponema sp.]|jgi:DNA mismatch repair protein MutS|nr:DNA mismatch repair protein MutS [Treponema sp.]
MGDDRSSPMLDQYRRIKRDHQGDVLFFRLGDFYEMFAEDAAEVSSLLNLTLTSRNGLPMCGIPYHAARSYIARLLKCGKKIAICEQLSEPGSGNRGQKLIERQVVEIITPGTTVDEDYLDRGSSNYLAALSAAGGLVSFAYIDLSTGGFYATSFPLDNSSERLRQELERLQAQEMLVQESLLEENAGIARALADRGNLVLNRWADWLFDGERAKRRLQRQFGLATLKSFGLEDGSAELLSAGAVLDYLDDTSKGLLPHVRSITVYTGGEFVGIDESSMRNLELIKNIRDGGLHFSLLEIIDETRCAMGKRLLKWRLLHPLRDIKSIQARLDIVETLYRDQGSLNTLRELLGRTPDLQRLSSRLAMDKAHGKDMLAIKNALASCKAVRELRGTLNINCESDNGIAPDGFARLTGLNDLLERGICDEPSILLTEGNLIRDGYNAELDNLRRLRDSGRQLLEAYLEEEKLATGISSLKIRYNRLIGYFFEVTKTHLERVPEHFIRRQGIVGGERFSTERLAALESDINGASDKIVELERRLFLEIREQAKEVLGELAAEACRVAEVDAAQSLARAASIRGWTRPVVDGSNALEIYEARHPVVEAYLGRGEFIPNDILLNNQGGRVSTGDSVSTENNVSTRDAVSFAMITGPNMAGKSTYLRSAALITLMAQMGSFIPAREGRIGLCDRIYCRVGASDNLARGESTFLVEMNETAYILNTATEKSLVIMDEVGRGTGTNDGLSIAWAVSEELLSRINCRTFFATHYHELSLLQHPRLANRSMEVLEKDGGIVFLRRLREGPAAESYGLHVARLAGLSPSVLERAKEIMERLRERDAGLRETLPTAAEGKGRRAKSGNRGLGTGEERAGRETMIDAVVRELSTLNPDAITPIEALGLLNEWKRRFTTEGNAAPPSPAVVPAAGSHSKPRGGKAADTTPSLFD